MLITRRTIFVLAAVALFASRSVPAFARTLVVPRDEPTIQAAVDAARDGDTVRVEPGTYPESVTWTAKNIRLVGAGPDTTIVDPSLGPGGRCFTITGVPSGALASGFTCQHGSVSPGDGGGMLLQDSSLTVGDFVVADNKAVSDFGGGGAGVRVQGGSPVFRDVQFLRNDLDFVEPPEGVSGAGMYITDAAVALHGCVFDDNLSAGAGAGIAVNGALSLFDCAFHRNTVSDRAGGGAIDVIDGSVIATRSTFEENLVSSGGVGRGGAVNGTAGSGTFIECTFHGNNAAGRTAFGGAIDGFAELTVLRSDFAENAALGDAAFGGAISTGGTLTVVGSNFSDNQASVRAEGGAIQSTGPTVIVNSTFRDNIAHTGPVGGAGGAVAVHGETTIVNSLFFANQTTLLGTLVPSAKGGALWVAAGANARVIHSVFTRNVSVNSGAVAIEEGASATIINSILFGDTPREIDNEGTLVVIRSIVQGGVPGPGNIDRDPLFVDAERGDLHLLPGSPAIDAGTFIHGIPRDLDGNPRVIGPRPDMGPYELGETACTGK